MTQDEKTVYRALDSSTRLEILRLITKGPHKALEIAKKLGIELSTVRYHLKALESVGLIKVDESRGGVGKPKFYYRLSDSIPLLSSPKRQYFYLADSLISRLRSILGESEFRKIITKAGESIGFDVINELAKAHQVERWTIEKFKDYYVDKYLAELAGEPRIAEYTKRRLVYHIFNCAFKELALKYPHEICHALEEGQVQGISRALGIKLTRTKCIGCGNQFCEFILDTEAYL